MSTVREATLAVLRRYGVRRVFGNPGSTELAFLADLPDDLEFVLALHEGSVVGMATGYALATGRPAVVNLHTTAGLGNAVGALATARVNRAPLVVLVGQQDRRHLAAEPFLAGRLDRLADPYPVRVEQPVLAEDVPAAVRRAWHEAALRRGPALVVVPTDDWAAEVDPSVGRAAPERVAATATGPGPALDELARLVDGATSPVLVVGAGADQRAAWDALAALADRIGAPVWQEAFGARAGFPQHHPRFAGHLPAARSRLRATLAGHDLALVVGTAAFRQYVFESGPLLPPGLTVAVVSADPDELHRSEAALAVLADPALTCAALAARVAPRDRPAPDRTEPAPVPPPAPGEPLRATHVFAALARRLPADVVLVEETPSSRPELHRMLPARRPGGFVSAAMGGLGFGLPAAAGLRLGDPTRPVLAVLGDGSSLYAIQGLWSAARYGCGVLYLVLSNGRYAVLDRLAEQHGGKPPWPAFDEVDVTGLARSFGCPARRIRSHPELLAVLDEVLPDLADRTGPLLLDVAVHPEPHFAP
ncbi:thiamine pyrophosphate-binding protein [Plantactinospora sp. WMMB782]|uniref:thiamine pyrophosphate-binding protein n=1 Tax=Plantactinospora sp. WMMB782 TaxID=3404121 RepID=UPI003B934BAF